MERTTQASAPPRATPRSDRYQVVEKLGEGGMAVVYRAVDNTQRRWCALKVLHPEYRDNEVVRQRFEAEGRAMSRLRHRNLIEVWDVQVEADPPFFAMELATGGSVNDWVQQHGAMPPRMAVDILIQMCKALRVAHDEGLVHRDVKPQNILVTRRGVCKLTDFGIARHDDGAGLTQDGSGLGTLGFIAPEQKDEASRVDHRADIYSLGATLHFLLTGRTTLDLYLADQEPEMMDQVPEPLREAITRATRYRPDDRHATVNDLAKALFQARGSLPEDPADTPSLVTNKGVEPDDRELERFVSVPAPADRVDTLSDDEPSGAYEGLARDSLMRASLPSTRRRKRRDDSQWRAAALGSLPLLALGMLLLGVTSARVQAIHRAVDAVAQSQALLGQTIESEGEVVAGLAALGADQASLEAAWSAARSQQGAAQLEAVARFHDVATRELATHRPAESSTGIRHYRESEQRLRRIADARSEAERARAWDLELRSGAIGAAATLVAPTTP